MSTGDLLIINSSLITFRGEEVAVALDFVRGMDENGLKLLLEQGEVKNIVGQVKNFTVFP